MSNGDQENRVVWGQSEAERAVQQLADVCHRALGLKCVVSPDGASFRGIAPNQGPYQGLLAVDGRLVAHEGDIRAIAIALKLASVPETLHVALPQLLDRVAGLGEKIQILSPQREPDGSASIGVQLTVRASPLSPIRESAILTSLERLDRLARFLQAELPTSRTDEELQKLYEPIRDFVEPIYPLQVNLGPSASALMDWAHETLDFSAAALSVALVAPFRLQTDYALAALATAATQRGHSIGQLRLTTVTTKGVLEIASKAPGIIAVTASRIALGANPYELAKETQVLLPALSATGKAALFTGTLEELQSVFSGGQGGIADPLLPIVRHVPEVPTQDVARFSVHAAAVRIGGLSEKAETDLSKRILAGVKDIAPAEQLRILAQLAHKAVQEWSTGTTAASSLACFAKKLTAPTETLAGLSTCPRVSRSATVQERLITVLGDADAVFAYLQVDLLAQDEALWEVSVRLATEVLTRPAHQPIRYCAQGTPATAKSETAARIARRLSMPLVRIDAASLSDPHTANSQLLGSGRGIVNSHRPGRLEQAAKHATGAVVEVSDLDHAVPSVRAPLADLFLQILDTGEAQSATGAIFSCANLIFVFTMNLPGGVDEAVRKGIGFTHTTNKYEVRQRVIAEIKQMLSGAFLSRVGTPILYAPLEGGALALILERAIERALITAAEHLRLRVRGVVLEPGVGATLIDSLKSNITAFGARALLEHGRTMAAKALMGLHRGEPRLQGTTLIVSTTPEGDITIHTDPSRRH